MFKLEFDREHLWQWDLNQRLILTEVEAGVEVHFSHPFIADLDKALPVYTYEENGVMCADIPNRVLQVSGYFKAYIYESGREDEAHTKMSISVDIKEREQPADYIYEETDIVSYAFLLKKIEELENKEVSSDVSFEVEGEEELIETQISVTSHEQGNVVIETIGIEVEHDGQGNVSLISDNLIVTHDGQGNVSVEVG